MEFSLKGKMQERNQLVKEEKAVRLKELKDEMLKAEKRKQEEKEKEAENDWNIALEQQEIEKRQIEQEEVLRYVCMLFVIVSFVSKLQKIRSVVKFIQSLLRENCIACQERCRGCMQRD